MPQLNSCELCFDVVKSNRKYFIKFRREFIERIFLMSANEFNIKIGSKHSSILIINKQIKNGPISIKTELTNINDL